MLDDAAFPSHGYRVYVSIKDGILSRIGSCVIWLVWNMETVSPAWCLRDRHILSREKVCDRSYYHGRIYSGGFIYGGNIYPEYFVGGLYVSNVSIISDVPCL